MTESPPAIPQTIVDNNIVTMPGDEHVGMWGNILIADTGNNRVIEVNPKRVLNPEPIDGFIEAVLETTDFPAITLQIGYSEFTDDSTDPYDGFWAAEPAPCNYNQDHSVNGPVWAVWLQSETWRIFRYRHGGLLLVVVAGFDGCPDNRVRIFFIHYRDCYAPHTYHGEGDGSEGNEGLFNTDYGFDRGNCSKGFWSFGSRLPGSSLFELDHPTHAMQLAFDDYNGPVDQETHDYSQGVKDDNAFTYFYEGCGEQSNDYGESTVNGDILITDQGNNRILRVDFCTQKTEWWYGPRSGPAALNAPSMTQQLLNGNIFIADTGNHRVVEINIAGMFVSQLLLDGASRPVMFGIIESLSSAGCGCIDQQGYDCDCWSDSDPNAVCFYPYCSLRNTDFDTDMGTYLVADAANNTFTQYEKNGHVRFVHDGNYGELASVVRIMHKDFYLVTDRAKHRVTVWDKFKNKIVWQYSDLNRPSSATMVGEETGMSRSNFWSSFLWWWY